MKLLTLEPVVLLAFVVLDSVVPRGVAMVPDVPFEDAMLVALFVLLIDVSLLAQSHCSASRCLSLTCCSTTRRTAYVIRWCWILPRCS
eukprot:1956934-Pyramimonas_sp.AAC.1